MVQPHRPRRIVRLDGLFNFQWKRYGVLFGARPKKLLLGTVGLSSDTKAVAGRLERLLPKFDRMRARVLEL
jgi:hypothetical protein